MKEETLDWKIPYFTSTAECNIDPRHRDGKDHSSVV